MKSKFLCAVSVLKDEGNFVDEWLVYHKMLGIEHFFLFDDGPDLPLESLVQGHEGYCTIIPWYLVNETRRNGQIEAFRFALSKLIKEFEWVIFLDVDEFVVLKEDKNINKFLARFSHAAAVSLNWHLFGHNGFLNDTKRLVTSSLTKRRTKPHHEEKTFSRTSSISKINSPHYCELKSGLRVDANGKKFNRRNYPEKTKLANINHYQCRSFVRWMSRADRGDVNYLMGNCGESEKWRFDETLLFEKFVLDIARNNNEIEDTFLIKKRFDIQKRLNEIERNRAALRGSLKKKLKEKIEVWLALYIKQLNLSSNFQVNYKDSHCLLEVIILFHYAQYTRQFNYKVIAEKRLTEIIFWLKEIDVEEHYSNFFEFGIAVEYLVKQTFLRKDTNRYLKEIDLIASYRIFKLLNLPLNNGEVLKQLAYYISRLNNPFNNPHDEQELLNKENIQKLISIIIIENWTLNELLNLLEQILKLEKSSLLAVLPIGFVDKVINLVSDLIKEKIEKQDFQITNIVQHIIILYRCISNNYQTKLLELITILNTIYVTKIRSLKAQKIYKNNNEQNGILELFVEKERSLFNPLIGDFEVNFTDILFTDSSTFQHIHAQKNAIKSLLFLKVLNEALNLPYELFNDQVS